MNKTNNTRILPELRFPEFMDAEEWDEKKLNEVCKINPSISKLPEFFVYIDLESVEAGVLLQKKIIALESAPSRAQRLLKASDIIYQTVRPYQKNNYFFQKKEDIEYVASTGYAQLRAFESKMYLFQYLHNDLFVSKVLAKCTGSNYPAINSSDLSEISIEIPKPDEQQKIADFLSSLDELITAQNQKLEALQAHKKGLLQNLFPADGETLPLLRFKEFEDDGDWKIYTIGDKANLLSGFPFKSSEISEDSKGTPLLRGINITEGTIRHSQDIDRFFLGEINDLKKYILQINDLVIGMDGSKVGKNSALITEEDSGSLLIQRVARLRAKNKETIKFIFHHINSTKFHSYVDRINTSSGIPHISAKQINDFEIYFPENPKEQQKIADCLTSIDELITTQNLKLETLKKHKKGLMQQLFPNTI